ncbi:unnamed protein product, partial [Symbiodinium sp. KB8]
MCESCEKTVRPSCAGLVPGLEFLADTGSEEDLISKNDKQAHFPDIPIGAAARPVSLITANGPVQGNTSVKLDVPELGSTLECYVLDPPLRYVHAGKSPYFVTPEGKKLYCTLRGDKAINGPVLRASEVLDPGIKSALDKDPYPKHVVRTTWVFTKKWTELEQDLDIRMLENRVGKLPDPAVLSITIFKRPEDDPEPEADSEAEAESEPRDEKHSAQLKLEAESIEHKFTHRPKNPYCKVCQKAKMLAPHARKRGGSSTIMAKKFGDHVTIDHIITRDLRDFGIEGEKDGEQVYENLLHFLQVEDDVGIIYSDN